MTRKNMIRAKNPFHDPLVAELIEDPRRYRKMFSEQILIGETLQVFQPANVVLLGPQGAGKSMILNLVRYAVLKEWISKADTPPGPLKHIDPFLGISINLVRANFHAFGRRSVAKAMGLADDDHSLDASCASDFLINYLFREFLFGIQFLMSRDGQRFRKWLGIASNYLKEEELGRKIAAFKSWYGYYSQCESISSLLNKVNERLATWREFLNGNINEVPAAVWRSKASLEGPLHEIGNLLGAISPKAKKLPLFIVIDQYEVLPELNQRYGTKLQQVVNTLIKLRDPVVFYKIGARTHDWGSELRIWGADSRIEVQRDYAVINLADVLMKTEDSPWLFPDFARDVAYKRLVEADYKVGKAQIDSMLGEWTAEREAKLYFKRPSGRVKSIGPVSDAVRRRILAICKDTSPLELRLAGAWAIQRMKRKVPEDVILSELKPRPWVTNKWWRKERIGIALQQIASLANQKRRYFGWHTVMYLSGANISAFLLLCGEVWDMAIKMDADPTKKRSLSEIIQTEGIYLASERWGLRDKNENIGGRQRYSVLDRLGRAIRESLVEDFGISNPGHSGFSLREADFVSNEAGKKVARFLQNAVSWAIFEERPHTSKERKDLGRRKWYLHPILSPFFGIPHIRVKEPAYVDVKEVYEWIFGVGKIKFARRRREASQAQQRQQSGKQLKLPIENSG